MDREEIIFRVRHLGREQLLQLQQLLDQLEDHPENQTPETEPDRKDPESLK